MPILIIVSFFVLILMTVFNWSKNRNIIFLTLHLVSINIFAILHYWLVIDFNRNMVAIFSNHFTPFYLATGPLLYFYVRGVIKDEVIWKITDWFHLIPAAIQLVLILPYTFGYSFDEKVDLMLNLHYSPSNYLETYFNPIFNAIQSSIIRFISFGFYLILTFSLFVKYLRDSSKDILLSLQKNIVLRWILYLHLSLILLLSLYVYLIYKSNIDHDFALSSRSSVLQISLSFLIAINNLSLLFIPEIMFGLVLPREPKRSVDKNIEVKNTDLKTPPLKDFEYLNEISIRIDKIMNLNKPFLNKDFKLIHLANALEVPEHHLASCLRNIKEITFTDLKNSYRIAVFKIRVINGDLKHFTVDALRAECGFQSKSSFYSAFYKIEGVTPLEYISKISSIY